MDANQEKKPAQQIAINLSIPATYANGITLGLTLSDVVLTLSVNGKPTQHINMSLTTAKTLLENLSFLISDYESKSKTKLLNMQDVEKFLNPSKYAKNG